MTIELEKLAFADGRIREISSNVNSVSAIFLDWQEQLWELKFDNVFAVENFNIEGEDLESIIVESDNKFLAVAWGIIKDSEYSSEEADLPLFCYSFFPKFSTIPRLRIVASRCKVKRIVN